MAPTPFDIYELNDAFAVDEAPTQGASSSPTSVMPQFFCTDKSDVVADFDVVLPEIADAAGLVPCEALTTRTAPNDLRTDGRQSVNPWDPRLVSDLALGVDSTEEVIDRYGLSKDEFERLCEVPAFRRDLSVAVRDLRENGTAYSERCKVMSSTYLERLDQLIYDNATPASTVLATVQFIATMGKLVPKETKADTSNNATQVNISICYT